MMLTLYHSHQTRSSRMLALIHEFGLQTRVTLKYVSIPRQNGTGGRDPANPHPEGKVPALTDGDTLITESAAIMLYLSDMFPEAQIGPAVGDAGRGEYLTWLFWYQGVFEPVYVAAAAELSHPFLTAAFRGVAEVEARLVSAFADGRPYLLGDTVSAADFLIQSPYLWFPDWAPKDAKVQAWLERIAQRPAYDWAMQVEAPYLG
jgi:glutathione S-transferase